MKVTEWIRQRREKESKGLESHQCRFNRYLFVISNTAPYLLPVKFKASDRWQSIWDGRQWSDLGILLKDSALHEMLKRLHVDRVTYSRMNEQVKVAMVNNAIDIGGGGWCKMVHIEKGNNKLAGIPIRYCVGITGRTHQVVRDSWLADVIYRHWTGKKHAHRYSPDGKYQGFMTWRVSSGYRDMTLSVATISNDATDMIFKLGGQSKKIKTTRATFAIQPCLYVTHSNTGGRPIQIIPGLKYGDGLKIVTHRKHWRNCRHDGTEQAIQSRITEALDMINRNPPWASLRKQFETVAGTPLNHPRTAMRNICGKHKHMRVHANLINEYMRPDQMSFLDMLSGFHSAVSGVGTTDRFPLMREFQDYVEDPRKVVKLDVGSKKYSLETTFNWAEMAKTATSKWVIA